MKKVVYQPGDAARNWRGKKRLAIRWVAGSSPVALAYTGQGLTTIGGTAEKSCPSIVPPKTPFRRLLTMKSQPRVLPSCRGVNDARAHPRPTSRNVELTRGRKRTTRAA